MEPTLPLEQVRLQYLNIVVGIVKCFVKHWAQALLTPLPKAVPKHLLQLSAAYGP